MTEFIVRRFDENGVPETKLLTIEAANEQEAAEKACGIVLSAEVRPLTLRRANVRTLQTLNDYRHTFYVPKLTS